MVVVGDMDDKENCRNFEGDMQCYAYYSVHLVVKDNMVSGGELTGSKSHYLEHFGVNHFHRVSS